MGNVRIASPEESPKILYMLRPFLPDDPEDFPCLPNNKRWFCDFYHEQEELTRYNDLSELENFREYHERLREKFDAVVKNVKSLGNIEFVIFETPCGVYTDGEKICSDPFSYYNGISTQHLNFYTNLLSEIDSGVLPATLRKAKDFMDYDEIKGLVIETMEKILRIPVFPLICPYHIVSTLESGKMTIEARNFFEDCINTESYLPSYFPKTLESRNPPLLSFRPSIFDREEAKKSLPYVANEEFIRFNFYILVNAFYSIVNTAMRITNEEKIVVISKKSGYVARVIEKICRKIGIGMTNLELMRNHDGFSILGECDPAAARIMEGYELSLLEKVLYT